MNKNTDDDNCVITNYYQHGTCNVDQYVMMELLMVHTSLETNKRRLRFQTITYCKNSNTIRMILTKSRGPVEGLRIIQVN